MLSTFLQAHPSGTPPVLCPRGREARRLNNRSPFLWDTGGEGRKRFSLTERSSTSSQDCPSARMSGWDQGKLCVCVCERERERETGTLLQSLY